MADDTEFNWEDYGLPADFDSEPEVSSETPVVEPVVEQPEIIEVEPVEVDPEILVLEAQLSDLNIAMHNYEDELSPADAEHKLVADTIKAEKKAFEERMAALTTQAYAIEQQQYEIRRELNRKRQEAESVERQIEQARRLKIQQESFLMLEQRWANLMISAPWREWAKDHQMEAARKIATEGDVILADTMGLGKTLSVLIACDMIKAATVEASVEYPVQFNAFVGPGRKLTVTKPSGIKILYCCPATMIGNVIREVKQWAPHRSVVALGGQNKATRKFLLDTMTAHPEYICVLNYEAWRKDLGLLDDLIGIEFDTIIIDEAHNIKERSKIGYRGVKRLITEGNIPFVVPMTGTPILNRPQELFTLLTLVDPFHFNHERYFLSDYCQQDYNTGKWGFKTGGMDSLALKIRPQFLRRTKEQAGIELPPKTVTVHEILVDEERYPEQARIRNEMRQWGSIMLDAEAGKAISAAAAIAVYTRLRQIETWPDGIKVKDKDGDIVMQVECNESQKIDEVIRPNGPNHSYEDAEGLLPEVVEDERVVMFSQFIEPLKEIKRRCDLAGIRAVMMTGETSHETKEQVAIDFDARYTKNGEHKWDVVLAHYKVGGVGLNYTNATQMIVLDEEWNPGKRDQAYDRIHRMGQDKPVTIHVLRDKLPNNGHERFGIDVWLSRIIEAKEAMVDGFNDATDLAAEGLLAIKSGLI